MLVVLPGLYYDTCQDGTIHSQSMHEMRTQIQMVLKSQKSKMIIKVKKMNVTVVMTLACAITESTDTQGQHGERG